MSLKNRPASVQKKNGQRRQTDLPDTTAAGTVARVVRLLLCLAEAENEVSIKYICQKLNLPASTVHRLLHLLMEVDVVERGATRALYSPGPQFVRIASLVASRVHIVDIAKPVMRSIADECDEACVLLQYIPTLRKVMALHAEYSSNPLRYQIELYQPHSLLWGASGRAVLAFLRQAELEEALKGNETSPVTGASLPARKVLLAELAGIRERRYAITQGQTILGAVGIAAPVFDADHRVIGSLSVTVPQSRFNKKVEAKVSQFLLRKIATLNNALGSKVETG